MQSEWLQMYCGTLRWHDPRGQWERQVQVAAALESEVTQIPEGSWVLCKLIAAEPGHEVVAILSKPHPSPDVLSIAEQALSSGRPLDALLELDALGNDPANGTCAALRIAALLALTPPAREDATAVLLALTKEIGWTPYAPTLAAQIGWSSPLANAAVDHCLRRPIVDGAIRVISGLSVPYGEPTSAVRFDRLQEIPPEYVSSPNLTELLELGAAEGVARRHSDYVALVRRTLEARPKFGPTAAATFAIIEADLAKRNAEYREREATFPEWFLQYVESYFDCKVPNELRSRWRAAVGGASDSVAFLKPFWVMDQEWCGPELHAGDEDTPHLALPFAYVDPDAEPHRYFALDLTSPVAGPGGEIDYPVMTFVDDETDAPAPPPIRRIADTSSTWLAG